jgi:hypothetical protein
MYFSLTVHSPRAVSTEIGCVVVENSCACMCSCTNTPRTSTVQVNLCTFKVRLHILPSPVQSLRDLFDLLAQVQQHARDNGDDRAIQLNDEIVDGIEQILQEHHTLEQGLNHKLADLIYAEVCTNACMHACMRV